MISSKGCLFVEDDKERIADLERQRTNLQTQNNILLERARHAEAELAKLKLFRFEEVAASVAKAESRKPFADLNHVLGVLYEEVMLEFAKEVHANNPAKARLELYDIVGAAIKAIKAIERKEFQ